MPLSNVCKRVFVFRFPSSQIRKEVLRENTRRSGVFFLGALPLVKCFTTE